MPGASRGAMVARFSMTGGAMALAARRLGLETWREAVARGGARRGRERECLAAFEARLAEGAQDFEAAYLALEASGCLDTVDLPGDPAQPQILAERDQIEPPGS